MKEFLPDMAGHHTIQLTVVVTACTRPRQDQASQNPSRDGGPGKVPCLPRTMRGSLSSGMSLEIACLCSRVLHFALMGSSK